MKRWLRTAGPLEFIFVYMVVAGLMFGVSLGMEGKMSTLSAEARSDAIDMAAYSGLLWPLMLPARVAYEITRAVVE